jgi:hypothetical protein
MQNELAVDDFLQPDDLRMVAEGLTLIANFRTQFTHYFLHVLCTVCKL